MAQRPHVSAESDPLAINEAALVANQVVTILVWTRVTTKLIAVPAITPVADQKAAATVDASILRPALFTVELAATIVARATLVATKSVKTLLLIAKIVAHAEIAAPGQRTASAVTVNAPPSQTI